MSDKYLAYPEYKESGVEWLGRIPKNWIISKVRYLTECLDGQRVPLNAEQRGEIPGNYPYWGANGVVDYVGKWLFDEDLVLIGEDGAPFFDTNKDVAFNVSDKIWVNNHAHILRPKRGSVCGTFLKYALNRVDFHLYINGSTRDKLTQADLNNISLRLPSVEEQRTIAAFLDYETARIDRLIAQQQRLIELLKEKRQAVISHAVTKGLNPNAPMKDSGVEWLGQVPKHWIVAGFKKYIEPIVDYRGKTPTKTESGVFLVTARNIKNGSIDYHLSEEFISEDDYEEVMRRGKPKLGDVLFTTEAPLGEVAQVDNESIALAQRIIKFRGLRDILDCSYLKLFIQSTEFQHGLMTFATGSTALGIKSDRLGYLKQLVPPISEQSQIVEVVAKHAMQFGKLIDIANKAIQLMQERRTALISAAVTGKIDLRGWTQPAEEVAA